MSLWSVLIPRHATTWQVNRRMRVRSLTLWPTNQKVHQLLFRVRVGCGYRWRIVTQVWEFRLMTNGEILARLLIFRQLQRHTDRFIEKTGEV